MSLRPLAVLLALAAVGTLAAAGAADASASSSRLQRDFAAASREFHVPRSVLLALSYNESLWEQRGGRPSTSGGYGVMHLTDVPPGARGRSSRAQHTLRRAARLLGERPASLKRDPRQNVRGGAALLARYARDTTGRLSADPGDWYGAVAKYGGSALATVAREFAGDVYATIRRGAARTTSDGQVVRLRARAVRANRATGRRLHLRSAQTRAARTAAAPSLPECPRRLACRYVPAAYVQNDPNDPSDYGNYDLADRPRDGLDVRYVVIHDTEETFEDTLATFQDPHSYVSAHYVVRSSDGFVAQMVPTRDVAWQAGNWYVNTHSVGIENEGFAIEGAPWYSEPLDRAANSVPLGPLRGAARPRARHRPRRRPGPERPLPGGHALGPGPVLGLGAFHAPGRRPPCSGPEAPARGHDRSALRAKPADRQLLRHEPLPHAAAPAGELPLPAQRAELRLAAPRGRRARGHEPRARRDRHDPGERLGRPGRTTGATRR